MRIAIIGAGHSGISLANKLINTSPGIQVDLFEQTPTPFGLIRYGARSTNPQLRLFGNITIGTDLHLAELRSYYQTIIDTTTGKRIDAPGHGDIRPLLEARNLAYTSWEGNTAAEEIDWEALADSARGIPVWA